MHIFGRGAKTGPPTPPSLNPGVKAQPSSLCKMSGKKLANLGGGGEVVCTAVGYF